MEDKKLILNSDFNLNKLEEISKEFNLFIRSIGGRRVSTYGGKGNEKLVALYALGSSAIQEKYFQLPSGEGKRVISFSERLPQKIFEAIEKEYSKN